MLTVQDVARNAQYADLAGESSREVYDGAIAELRDMIRELRELRDHSHDWNDDDYCRICGADGRA